MDAVLLWLPHGLMQGLVNDWLDTILDAPVLARKIDDSGAICVEKLYVASVVVLGLHSLEWCCEASAFILMCPPSVAGTKVGSPLPVLLGVSDVYNVDLDAKGGLD